MQTISELKNSSRDQKTSFEAVVVLKKASVRKARNDSEFLMVEFGDRTGIFHVVCFENSANYQFFQNLAEGTILRIQGHTDYYQGRFSPNLSQVEKLPEEMVSRYLDRLIETAPIPLNELWQEFNDLVSSIQHEALRETVKDAIKDIEPVFKISPAAISMHHAYRGGLIEHSVRMGRAAKALLPLYPEVFGDLAMAGILLHDIGKCIEYTGDMATRKSALGIMQGHVVLGYRMVRRSALKAKLSPVLTERLEHIILSHQGELEWGAAAKAATPEAVFVSMVDNLDAKMGMVQQALRMTPEAEDFSEFIAGLGAPLLVKPVNAES